MFKFNNGNGAVLCDNCRKILKVGWIPEDKQQELSFCNAKCEARHQDKMLNDYIEFNGGDPSNDF